MSHTIKIKLNARRIKPWYTAVSESDYERLEIVAKEEKEFVMRVIRRTNLTQA
jgi:hypothetical protein